MNKFKVALLQLIPSNESSENLDKGIKYCKLAKEMGADLALFPEMWNIGYNFPPETDGEKLSKGAIDSNSVFFYAYGKPDCNGHSLAYDGIAYGETSPPIILNPEIRLSSRQVKRKAYIWPNLISKKYETTEKGKPGETLGENPENIRR
jgi:hypothetical protein